MYLSALGKVKNIIQSKDQEERTNYRTEESHFKKIIPLLYLQIELFFISLPP